MSHEDTESVEAGETLHQAAAFAEHLQRLGVSFLPAPDAERVAALASQLHIPAEAQDSVVASPSQPATQPVVAQPTVAQPAAATASPASSSELFALETDKADQASYAGESLPVEDRKLRLTEMAEKVDACSRCEILAKCRTKTVFGEGSPTPRFAFFGEGPGRDEDLSGRPFVGKAGQLLTKMIEACKLSREDVYIFNTVKCRPPNNRNPEPTEVENCREYFEDQLNVLRPEYIVCLGLVSAQALLKNKLSVGRMRGKLHRYNESKVLVTYHPSYLLRTPAAKKAAWEDLQLMLRDAGLL